MFFQISNIVIPLTLLITRSLGHSTCKNHPSSGQWPTENEWQVLNQSVHGALLRGVAPASSCYEGNPLGSKIKCKETSDNWFYSSFHGKQPASIGYNFWANNSCVAPTDYAFDETKTMRAGWFASIHLERNQCRSDRGSSRMGELARYSHSGQRNWP